MKKIEVIKKLNNEIFKNLELNDYEHGADMLAKFIHEKVSIEELIVYKRFLDMTSVLIGNRIERKLNAKS